MLSVSSRSRVAPTSRIDLTPETHDRDRRVAEGGEVRGFVPTVPGLAVDAAEAAGREHFDADPLRDDAGRRNRGRCGSRACQDDREVPHAGLDNVVTVRDGFELIVVSPTKISPSRMAMVAGVAPLLETMDSISRATRMFSGRGNP